MHKNRQPPRGIRNHNPGNIERNHITWQGMRDIQDDPRFVQFTTPVYGLRALMKVLLTYQRKHGLSTISGIVERWAPKHENPTRHYAAFIAGRLRMGPDDDINLEDSSLLILFARGIVAFENGWQEQDWYPPETYVKAAALALL